MTKKSQQPFDLLALVSGPFLVQGVARDGWSCHTLYKKQSIEVEINIQWRDRLYLQSTVTDPIKLQMRLKQ